MRATRRNFLRDGSALAIARLAAATNAASAEETESTTPMNHPALFTPSATRRGEMLFRQFGNTGEEVSLIGLGGHHIGRIKDAAESIRFMRSAIDRGITFMDNSWDYHEGESEVRMGRALQDGYRDKVFLMTKIDGRTRASAARQIDESLQRLDVDHVDLMQLHEVIRIEDADRAFAEGGAFEAMRAAQQAGKIRYLGFTGHKDPLVHLRTLDVAREHGVRFDAVQMPISIMDAHFRSFTYDVLPRLVEEGTAPLAMKTFADPYIFQYIRKTGVATPVELLQYSMSLPVAVVITGMDTQEMLDQAFEAVRTFDPHDSERRQALVARVKHPALTGDYERYKTTDEYDATAKNPAWLG